MYTLQGGGYHKFGKKMHYKQVDFDKHGKKTVSVVSHAVITFAVVHFRCCHLLVFPPSRVLMALCTHLGLVLITTPLSWRPSPVKEAEFITSLTPQKRYVYMYVFTAD
jgi:hypothetical protein